MSYVTLLKQIFKMTICFQWPRLFCKHLRSNPAVAISFVDHNCVWTSNTFDCAQCRCRSDQCGRSVFALCKNVKTDTCALYVHHRHICAWPTHLMIPKSLFCRRQTLTVMECDPGSHNTIKYIIWVVLVVRNSASGPCINYLFAFRLKTYFSHLAL